MVEVLYAYMNGRFVGELRRESDGELSFIYEDSWLEATEVHRSLSLSIRLQNKEHRGESVRNFFVVVAETKIALIFREVQLLCLVRFRDRRVAWSAQRFAARNERTRRLPFVDCGCSAENGAHQIAWCRLGAPERNLADYTYFQDTDRQSVGQQHSF